MPISRSPKWVRSLSEWGTSFPGRLTQPGDQDLQNWHTHTRQRVPAPVQVYFPSGDHKQCQHRTERGMLLQEKLLLVMFLHTCFPKCNYTLETAKLNTHDNHTTTHYPGKGTGWESMSPWFFFAQICCHLVSCQKARSTSRGHPERPVHLTSVRTALQLTVADPEICKGGFYLRTE